MTKGMLCSKSIINGALVTARKNTGSLLPLIMRWRVLSGIANRLPCCHSKCILRFSSPADQSSVAPMPLNNVNQLLVEMIFRIERAAGRDLADVHAGETFHAFEIDVGAVAAGALPGLERQAR